MASRDEGYSLTEGEGQRIWDQCLPIAVALGGTPDPEEPGVVEVARLDGPHVVSNGVLLRSDLHRLFDRGYITVTAAYRLEVSDKLKEHFQNGKSYYPLHGQSVHVPDRTADRPGPDLLRWHNEHVFLG